MHINSKWLAYITVRHIVWRSRELNTEPYSQGATRYTAKPQPHDVCAVLKAKNARVLSLVVLCDGKKCGGNAPPYQGPFHPVSHFFFYVCMLCAELKRSKNILFSFNEYLYSFGQNRTELHLS